MMFYSYFQTSQKDNKNINLSIFEYSEYFTIMSVKPFVFFDKTKTVSVEYLIVFVSFQCFQMITIDIYIFIINDDKLVFQ